MGLNAFEFLKNKTFLIKTPLHHQSNRNELHTNFITRKQLTTRCYQFAVFNGRLFPAGFTQRF